MSNFPKSRCGIDSFARYAKASLAQDSSYKLANNKKET